MTFDGNQSSGYKKKTATNSEEGKNDYLAPNISKLDTKSNAFLIMPQAWDENAMQQIVNAQNAKALDKWREQEERDVVQGTDETDEDYAQRKAEYEAANHSLACLIRRMYTKIPEEPFTLRLRKIMEQ